MVIANWKMHKVAATAQEYAAQLMAEKLPACDMIVAASFTLLPVLRNALLDSPILIAAQNMYTEDEGPFTGEISPVQLRDEGVAAVIIGHSERRRLFHEDNVLLNKKVQAAQRHGLLPIYCVGETTEERERGEAEHVVRSQIEQGLKGVDDTFIGNMIIAYEPVWAIGTGNNASPAQAEEMHAFIRTLVPQDTRILYGGSVTADNAASLAVQPSIDGFLVGGASVEAQHFLQIARILVETKAV